jgi:hypothetical protein
MVSNQSVPSNENSRDPLGAGLKRTEPYARAKSCAKNGDRMVYGVDPSNDGGVDASSD